LCDCGNKRNNRILKFKEQEYGTKKSNNGHECERY